MLTIDQPVRINTPDNERLHNSTATVRGVSFGPEVDGERVSVYYLDAPAAHSGTFRALAHEVIPEDREPRALREIGVKPTRPPDATGDVCPVCGGLMVQTGKCKTCQSCGQDTGGCS